MDPTRGLMYTHLLLPPLCRGAEGEVDTTLGLMYDNLIYVKISIAPWLVLVGVLLHWATTALPLIVVSPLLAEMLHLPHDQLPMLLASLLLGTPLLSLIGGVVAALTVGIRRSGILVALLSLPLYVPVLVFGAGSLAAAGRGQDPVGALLMLGAGLLVALVLAPLATAAAIRISLS